MKLIRSESIIFYPITMNYIDIKYPVSKFKNFILDLLFPIQCLECGEEFENLEPKKRWICEKCLKKIETRKEQVCPVCERLSEGGETHRKCREKTSLDGLWVAVDYKIASKAIHKFKFDFIKDISFPLSMIAIKSVLEVQEFTDFQDLLLANFSQESGEDEIYTEKIKNKKAETILVPVPLHRKRYNWRGFNQAFLLAKYIANKFKLPVYENLIIRKKNTKSQTKIKSVKERRKNIKGAFFCPPNNLVKNKNIIIVDDVCTTLATLDECAIELKKAGAKKVWGLTVARR
ncbi:MAG: ComF family protein [Patescibacteria group bacterium]|nr:ComF family protein [Patescibacteria group bacterium]